MKFFRTLFSDYPWRFLAALFSTHFGVKGIYIGIARSLALPFFKLRGVTGQRYHDFMTIAMLPWACKPFMGALSDALYLFGYSKRVYLIFSCFLAALMALLLATVDVSTTTAAGLFTLANVGVMVVDLLMEGKYSELMATRAKGRPEIVTYVWAVCLVGGLIASITVGPLADRGWISKLCWVAFAFALQGIMPPLLGWIPETKIKGSCVKLHKDKLLEHRHMFALAASMSLIATGLVMVTFFSNYIGKLSYSLLGAAFLTILSFRVLPKTLACCNCYLFLQDTLSFSLSGALEYFFTADEECLPGGPKFSYMFFFTCMHPCAPRILSNAHPRIRVGARVRHLRTHRHWFIPVETQNFQSPSHFRAYDSSKNFRCPI